MIKPLLSVYLITALLVSGTASAQVSFGGQPIGLGALKSELPDAPVKVMPAVDAVTLMVEDAERMASGNKMLRFGQNHATDFTLDNSGTWTTLANGDRVWRLGIECPGALSINFEFSNYIVPDGGLVFVYNTMGHTLGAFTAASHPGHTVLGVDLLAGDRITIEYLEPAGKIGQGQLAIGQVTHGYRDVFGLTKGFGDSGTCNNNAVCPINTGYLDQIRSVAMIVSGGSGFCTGQLLNSCAEDGTPYFLTANHCLQGGNPTTWVYRFNWQSPVCTPNTNGPTNQSVSGSTLLYNSAGSDVAFLELNTTPPSNYNVFYSGWDKSTTPATEVRCIHHPSGDIKKFSIEEDPVISGTFSGAQCWHVQAWDDGTTEPGSSGAGLWNQDGRLVGQLFGGQASCSFNFNDYFGKFSTSYPGLQQWLGNCGNTVDGVGGNVSVSEALGSAGMEVYPNPSAGVFTLVFPRQSQGDVRLRVSDALGRLVSDHTMTTVENMATLDLSTASEGVYHLEVTAGATKAVQRIVVQR